MKKLTIILFAFTVLATVARGQGKSKADGDTTIMLSTATSAFKTGDIVSSHLTTTAFGKYQTIDWNKTDTIAVTLIVPFASDQYNNVNLKQFFGYIVIKKYGSVIFVIAGKNHYVTPTAFLNKFKKPFELPVLYWIED